MPRPLRSEIYCPQDVSIFHVVQRCVRRSYLSVVDSVSGRDYSYRKEWIRQRIEKLASIFGVDVFAYASLSNHLPIVLRNRPDVVKNWSDKQVALRWLQIFPGKRIEEQLGDPTTSEVDQWIKRYHPRIALSWNYVSRFTQIGYRLYGVVFWVQSWRRFTTRGSIRPVR